MISADIVWQDETSWSHNDDDETRKSPMTYVASLSPTVRLVVTRHLHVKADQWVLRCDALGIEQTTPSGMSALAAQTIAVQLAQTRIRQLARALGLTVAV